MDISRYQQGVEKLLPTARTLVTTIVKKADISFPQCPDPTQYGWKKLDNRDMEPVINDIEPAPTYLTELIMCHCKTDCLSRKCHCRKNDIVCTDLCKCSDCVNSDETNPQDLIIDSSDDEE